MSNVESGFRPDPLGEDKKAAVVTVAAFVLSHAITVLVWGVTTKPYEWGLSLPLWADLFLTGFVATIMYGGLFVVLSGMWRDDS